MCWLGPFLRLNVAEKACFQGNADTFPLKKVQLISQLLHVFLSGQLALIEFGYFMGLN